MGCCNSANQDVGRHQDLGTEMERELALKCAHLSSEVYDDLNKFNAAPKATVTPIEAKAADLAGTGCEDTQAALLYEADSNQVTLVFRGSESLRDWMTNFRFRQMIYPYGEPTSTGVEFHRGFIAAYMAVRDDIRYLVKQYPTASLVFTGHSLGGALATICALDLQYNLATEQPIAVYTFGCPRIGNPALVVSYSKRVPNSFHFVYGRDLVARLPHVWQNYRHVPKAIHIVPPFHWYRLVQFLGISDHRMVNYVESLKPGGALP